MNEAAHLKMKISPNCCRCSKNFR